MRQSITVETLKEVLRRWPNQSENNEPSYLRVVDGISRYSRPPLYINELKILNGSNDLVIVPDVSDVDIGSDNMDATLIDLILHLITYEMHFHDFGDADFDQYHDLRQRVYEAARHAKSLNNMV